MKAARFSTQLSREAAHTINISWHLLCDGPVFLYTIAVFQWWAPRAIDPSHCPTAFTYPFGAWLSVHAGKDSILIQGTVLMRWHAIKTGKSSAVICSNSSSIPLFNTIESRECEDSSDKISISYLLLFSLLIGLIQSLSAFTAFWTAAASPTAGFLFANRPQCKDDQQQQK